MRTRLIRIPPAWVYSGVQLGSPVESLVARVETLDGIIRELVKTGPATETVDTAKERSPVWTTSPVIQQGSPATEQGSDADAGPLRPAKPSRIFTKHGPSITLALQEVQEDAVLSSDLRTKSGRLILSASSCLSHRQLDMLDNLVEMGEVIDTVEVYS